MQSVAGHLHRGCRARLIPGLSSQIRTLCAGGVQHRVQYADVKGGDIQFQFSDGAAFLFHALWLKDACRDANYVAKEAGERILSASPVVAGWTNKLTAKDIQVQDGNVFIDWNDSSKRSFFDASLLREYAEVVAKPLGKVPSSEFEEVKWLEPYNGYPGTKAPPNAEMELWNDSQAGLDLPRFQLSTLAEPEVNLELLKTLMRNGVAIIEGVPDCADATQLRQIVSDYLGGLQKDPAREEPNWTIKQKDNAKSISYNPTLRLNNHTDQSVPPHGIPGLLLAIHYVEGSGTNTLADGFAVAKALQKEDPEAFQLLATYGVDAERDFTGSRVDAAGNHNQSLIVKARYPILQTDAAGEIFRVQYNEVFRTPLSLPYDVFPNWYSAFSRFVGMCHHSTFEKVVPMKKGQILVMHNWRILHGRAGFQSPDRTLVGGTITRENFYSRALSLVRSVYA